MSYCTTNTTNSINITTTTDSITTNSIKVSDDIFATAPDTNSFYFKNNEYLEALKSLSKNYYFITKDTEAIKEIIELVP